jgi:hypothetical protein
MIKDYFDLLIIILIVIIFITIYNNINKNETEKFGQLEDIHLLNDDKDRRHLMQQINPTTKDLINIIENNKNITDIQNPNFNTMNNLPFLINPENPQKGYYFDKVKLITNPNSPLLQKAEENMKRINKQIKKCSNKTLDNNNLNVSGYNNWENLRESSYANITSVGKSLLTPYTSFPVAS